MRDASRPTSSAPASRRARRSPATVTLPLEDLRQRDEQYRAIFESSLDGLFLWDEHLRLVDVNPAGSAMYGHPREAMIGRTYPPTMPEEYVRRRQDMLRRALAGETTHVETSVLRTDGSSFDADLRVMPFTQRGRPHALAVVRDISERRRRDQVLRDSEEQYRTIFNASVDALVLRDAQFRIVDVNATYESMSGYSRAEVLGLDRILANPPEVRETIRRLHTRALAGEAIRLETVLQRRDGQHFDLELRGVRIQHRGQPHVLYIGRDITQARRADQRRGELERQLRQVQKMEAIGHLTGGIAHDFNNILTSVIGYVAMAEERATAQADAVLLRQLGQARLAAQRARDHVAQLLAFSRPHRGERRLVFAQPVAREALQLLRPNLPSSIAVVDPELLAQGDGEVPPVVADPLQLEQVLFNLCINARDAIEAHGTVRVRIGHSARAGHCASCGAPLGGMPWVWFEVADDGRGMTPEVIERMFEPFFTTKDVGQGTGMGLAMVHAIVHDHGGHVQVESAPGAGSVMRILLPPASPDAAGDAAAAVLHAAEAAPAALAPLQGRVLLVEDEPMVGDYMVELMTGWGLDVVLEHDPVAAAARVDSAGSRFDAMVTDQTMPGMTGLELARHAQQHRPELAVVLYTGNAACIDATQLAASGVAALLRKPAEPAALRALLQELIG